MVLADRNRVSNRTKLIGNLKTPLPQIGAHRATGACTLQIETPRADLPQVAAQHSSSSSSSSFTVLQRRLADVSIGD